jgi:inner membrane protein
MHAPGHYGAALLAYAPIGYVMMSTDPALALLGGFVVLGLATLPDIDQRLPGIPHRGPTHSLLFVAVASFALGRATNWLNLPAVQPFATVPAVEFGLLLGVVGLGSHLLADMITPAGLNLLWPVPFETIALPVAKAENTVVNYGLLGLGVVAAAAALYLGVGA